MEDRSHTQQVRHFFDRLAADYGERFTWRRPYHAWLFRERMRLATEGLDLDHASILDVGAGTGALYDFLTAHYRDLDYYACDLSAEMLRHSSIAAGRRFHGRITEITLPTDSFDFIFLLGVTPL